MTSLTLDTVSKAFGGVRAVDDLTLEIKPGEITGLIGPNGAGKSTVVNLISGLQAVTSGQIRLGKTDISQLQPHQIARYGIARTFQNIRLFGQTSVLDNLLIGYHRHEKTGLLANIAGLPVVGREYRGLATKAWGLMKRFNMERYADIPAGDLSYGHQRRVEMMRALATEPQFLLLDEPIAGMNDVEAGELGEIYRNIAEAGIGILLIEHNVGFVAAHCKSINVLNLGRLIASGSPETVLESAEVVEAYLGN